MSFSTILYSGSFSPFVTRTPFTRNTYIDSSSSILSHVTLGEGWMNIENDTFSNILSLIAINIPSSLISIGDNAFKNAVYLNSFEFNNSQTSSLNSIGVNAFFNAIRLTQITIPANVTSIGSGAFENASALTSITINSGSKLAFLGSRAFAGATKLTQITIQQSVVSIGENVFLNTTSLTSINVDLNNNNYSSDLSGVLFNKNKTILIQYPIGNTRTSYSIPIGVLRVNRDAFNGATALAAIYIPDSVNNIGENAFANMFNLSLFSVHPNNRFYNSDINGVLFDTRKRELIQYPSGRNTEVYTIPNSIVFIKDNAFINSTKLTKLKIISPRQYYTDSFGVLFDSRNTLVHYPIGNTRTSYEIPNSVRNLGPFAFYGASKLTSISFPNSCKIGSSPDYSGMTSLTSISIKTYTTSSSYTFLTVIDDVLFNKNVTILYKYPSKKTGSSYTIPDTVTEIARGAFDEAINLNTVTLNTFTFVNLSLLGIVRKVKTLTNIGSNAFKNSGLTNGLTNVILANSININDIELYIGTNQPFYGKSNVTVSSSNKVLSGVGQLSKNYIQLQGANNIDIQDYSSIGVAAFKDVLSITAISIPGSMTDIGIESFRGMTNLKTITFDPATKINRIPDSAFQGASSLTTIEIPKWVVSIGENAFRDASNLASITFSKQEYGNTILTSIMTSAFQGASNLAMIEIPSSVISIGTYAFRDASKLASITFAQNSQLTTIEDYAFQGASILTTITIPKSVTKIGNNAFSWSNITTVIFEESTLLDSLSIVPGFNKTLYGKSGITVSHITKIFTGTGLLSGVTNASLNGATRARLVGYTSIGSESFNGVTNLTHITISSSIGNIDPGYVIPASPAIQGRPAVTRTVWGRTYTIRPAIQGRSATPENIIRAPAFYNCPNLKNIIFESSTSLTYFGTNVGNVPSFRGAINVIVSIITLVIDRPGELTNATNNLQEATNVIIKGCSSIGSNAFNGASMLESVTIPKSVTSIGEFAFINCVRLKSIIFDASSNLKTIGKGAFSSAMNLTSIAISDTAISIGESAFSGTIRLTSITIPNSVTSIANNVFYESGIKTAIFDNSIYLSTVGLTPGTGKLLFGATNVNILVISRTFTGFGELTNAASYFSGENPSKFAVIEDYNIVGANAFKNATGLQAIDILTPLTVIKDSAFESTTSLTGITIPSSVSIIGQNAFKGSGIKSITFKSDTPSLLTNIGNYVFSDCSGLTEITIPDLVTSIGSYAFSGATSLTKVTLPKTNTITNIAERMFHGASALTTINIPELVTQIGEYAFTDCSALRQIVLPIKVTSIHDYAFKNSGLTQIYIPASVKSIGISAFAGASQLTTVTFDPDCDITNIGAGAFADCSNLTVVKMNEYDIDSLISDYPSSISYNKIEKKFPIFFGATNVNYTNNSPSAVPICFPKGTPVTTNQGNIAIELLNPDIHTIRNKRIIAITQSRPLHTYIVSIEKDALGSNIPNAKTKISKEHKVYYKGEMIKAKDLVKLCNGVTKIPYTGETLYNVLMENHDKMMINNLICETLHPDNILAKIHNGKYTTDEKNKLYEKLTELIESGDEPTYHKFYATLR